MALVFISHSSKDKEKSTQIKKYISQKGFESIFLDHDVEKGIRTGEEWEERLYEEMRASHILLVLLSPSWDKSKWCFSEYTHAKTAGKKIIPLIIEQDTPEKMKNWIGNYLQFADLTQDKQALDRVVDRIRELSKTRGGFELSEGRPPYPGMISFEEADADIFFGRDIETGKVIDDLRSMKSQSYPKSMMIVGASGMGKSSLLKAGVIPRIKRAYQDEWEVLPVLTPNVDTLNDLVQTLTNLLDKDMTYHKSLYAKLQTDTYGEALDDLFLEIDYAKKAVNKSFLLPIDQAENLYTQYDINDRTCFVRILVYMLQKKKNFFYIWTRKLDFDEKF